MDKYLYDMAHESNLAVTDPVIRSRAQAVISAATS
jgi:hypothetical protein